MLLTLGHLQLSGALTVEDEVPPSLPVTSGLYLWFDAADSSSVIHTANSVSEWRDKSPNLRHISQAIGANQPSTNTRALNGKNVIDYNGATSALLTTMTAGDITGIGTGNYMFNMVLTPDDVSVRKDFFFNGIAGAGNDNISLFQNTGGTVTFFVRINGVSGTLVTGAGVLVNGTPVILTFRRFSGVNQILANGVVVASSASAIDFAGFDNPNIMSIGNNNGTSSFDGGFAEFTSHIGSTNDDLNLLGEYFSDKWGVTWNTVV